MLNSSEKNLNSPQSLLQNPDFFPAVLKEIPLEGRWLTGEVQQQLIRIIQDTINQVSSKRSYFREEDIVKGTIQMAQREMSAKDIETDAFDLFIRHYVSQISFIVIGASNYITTEENAEMERKMLALAGEEDGKHLLPVSIVSDAIDKKRAPLPKGKGLGDDEMRQVLNKIEHHLKNIEQDLDVSKNVEDLKIILEEKMPQKDGDEGLSIFQIDALIHKLKLTQKNHEMILKENDYYAIKAVIDSKRNLNAPGISDEQETAVLAACRSNRRVTVIEGTAGAGKSYTMEAVKDAYTICGYQVIGTALSWNAAKVLESSAKLDNSVATEGLVQQMLEARASGTEYFRQPTLLIADEAGMLGTRHMFILLEESKNAKVPVKVVLTGDSLQLSPVDAGNALQAIVEFYGTVRINTIRRQVQESHRQAVYSFSERFAGQGLYTYLHQESITWCKNNASQVDLVVRDYLSYRYAFPGKQALVLAYSNNEVREINERIRQAYKKAGLIEGREIKVKVTDGQKTWENAFSVGDEVVMRSNDKNLVVYDIDPEKPLNDESTWNKTRIGAFNRNAGVIRGIFRSSKYPGSYDVVIDLHGERPGRVVLNTQRFKHPSKHAFPVTHNFATTIYASQGQTVHQVFLVDSPRMDFRLSYVAMSRHKEGVQVYINETELHQRLDSKITEKKLPLEIAQDKQDGVEVGELPLKLGQYNRSEMLQAVGRAWSKNSMNLTAMMFERDRRLGALNQNQKKKEPKPEELARLSARFSDESKIIDFIPETNQRYPLIDMKKLLSLPDPVSAHELIGPSQVFKSNQENTGKEMVLEKPNRTRLDISIPGHKNQTNQNNGEGLFSKVKGWWNGFGVQEDLGLKVTEEAYIPSPFEEEEEEKKKEESTLKKFIKLAVKSKVEMPFLPLEKNQGFVDRQNNLFSFENVAQTPGVSDPSPEFLTSLKDRIWSVGKWEEPRILARDGSGQIVARYRLDGRCVVGEGFPPMMLNRYGKPDTPIMIVPGPKEWFVTQDFMQKKHKDNPEKIPHMIWAAKDADWGFISKALSQVSTPVIIARSKTDEHQLGWALSLQKKLEEYQIKTRIVPEPDVQPSPLDSKKKIGIKK